MTRIRWCYVRYGFLVLCLAASCNLALAELDLYDRGGNKLYLLLELNGATFYGTNAYFGEAESFVGADVDQWSETAVEFGMGGEVRLGKTRLFGEVSVLNTHIYGDDASGLTIDADDADTTRIEQGHVGWTSGSLFGSLDEDALSITAGRFDYVIGTGLLIADGAADGGDRGAWWLGPRTAFKDSVLASFDSGPWLAEAFFIKNRARRAESDGEAWGANFETEFSSVHLGATFIRVTDVGGASDFASLNASSLRGDWSFGNGWRLSGEYVDQGKNNWEGEGYYLKGAYQWEDAFWSPEVSYRYSHLSGDDLTTEKREDFRPLAYGSTDYGTWTQGEISGNYPLENSNLNTHMIRMKLSPSEELTVNVLFYHFTLDEENIFGDPVSDDDFGDEVNIAADWTVNKKLLVVGTIGWLLPGDAGEEWTGGDDDWFYTMAYISYTF